MKRFRDNITTLTCRESATLALTISPASSSAGTVDDERHWKTAVASFHNTRDGFYNATKGQKTYWCYGTGSETNETSSVGCQINYSQDVAHSFRPKFTPDPSVKHEFTFDSSVDVNCAGCETSRTSSSGAINSVLEAVVPSAKSVVSASGTSRTRRHSNLAYLAGPHRELFFV